MKPEEMDERQAAIVAAVEDQDNATFFLSWNPDTGRSIAAWSGREISDEVAAALLEEAARRIRIVGRDYLEDS